mmetsp:Transcript_54483/g.129875  ORF Transcript_54483/g.129875 Transcript_54483/m.129875 type:complete len:219 (+) Transcript_54483:2295-2951(+)
MDPSALSTARSLCCGLGELVAAEAAATAAAIDPLLTTTTRLDMPGEGGAASLLSPMPARLDWLAVMCTGDIHLPWLEAPTAAADLAVLGRSPSPEKLDCCEGGRPSPCLGVRRCAASADPVADTRRMMGTVAFPAIGTVCIDRFRAMESMVVSLAAPAPIFASVLDKSRSCAVGDTTPAETTVCMVRTGGASLDWVSCSPRFWPSTPPPARWVGKLHI